MFLDISDIDDFLKEFLSPICTPLSYLFPLSYDTFDLHMVYGSAELHYIILQLY